MPHRRQQLRMQQPDLVAAPMDTVENGVAPESSFFSGVASNLSGYLSIPPTGEARARGWEGRGADGGGGDAVEAVNGAADRVGCD
ncbi:unnamed protein product, partial [Urochloa humidicola]